MKPCPERNGEGQHIKTRPLNLGMAGGLALPDKGPRIRGVVCPQSIDTNLKLGASGPLLSLGAMPLVPWDNSDARPTISIGSVRNDMPRVDLYSTVPKSFLTSHLPTRNCFIGVNELDDVKRKIVVDHISDK